MQKKYGKQGVAVVGVTQANEGDARVFQKELGATYPILAEGGTNFTNYKVSGLPASFLVAPDGVILAQGMDEIESELAKRFPE